VTPEAGAALPGLVVASVDGAMMKVMALLLRDPNPIHWDAESARALDSDPRPVNQGPTSLGYIVTMLTQWAGDETTIRQLHCRYLANVRAGDSVSAGGTVTDVRPAAGEDTVVECAVWLDVVGGDRAIEGTATLLLPPARTGSM
jgi:3-hydroxybutyryl-CoA dehydratase